MEANLNLYNYITKLRLLFATLGAKTDWCTSRDLIRYLLAKEINSLLPSVRVKRGVPITVKYGMID